MKNGVLGLVLSVFLSVNVAASHHEGGHDHKKKGHHRLEKMTKELSLNDSQVAKMKVLHEGFLKDMKALKDKKRASIKLILNAEQQVKFEAIKNKHHKRGKRRACCDTKDNS